MADAKVSALTADTTPALTDLLYEVKNPGTTPVSRKVTIERVLALGVGLVYKASVTLNNDQIKALRRTPIELVAAPGVGKIILPIVVSIITKFSAGAYTLNAATDSLEICWGGNTSGSTNFSSIFDSTSSILTFAGNQFTIFYPVMSPNGTQDAVPVSDETTKYENVSLTIASAAAADFTGGHADNTAVVTVIYAIVDA